jgi:hypothetical protein
LFPYWLLFGLCAAGAIQHQLVPGRQTQGGILLSAVVAAIVLMIGFRFEVGADWIAYAQMYSATRYWDFWTTLSSSDPGYMLLNWLVQRAGLGIWAVNLASGALFMWGLSRFSRRQPNPWLTMLVAVPYLIIVVAMGYTRQAVAIGILLAGIAHLYDRQSILRFAVYIIFAASFHKTAIIMLPLVALAVTRNRTVVVGSSITLGLLMFYLFLNPMLNILLETYVVNEYDSAGAAVRILMSVVPALIFLIFQRKFSGSEFERRLWRNLSYAALVAFLLLMIMESSTVVDRMALYVIPLQLLVFTRLPYVFSSEGKGKNPLFLLVIVYSAAVQFVWLNFADHSAEWVPYKLYQGQELPYYY